METSFVRKILFLGLWIFTLSVQFSYAQPSQVSINQIDSLMKVSPKPMLILLSTDWCQYCQIQKTQISKNKTFKQNSDQFYYVEFDAASKTPVLFGGKEYVYKPTGANIGTHSLAQFLNGTKQLSYPTWILVDPQYQIIYRHNGVLLPKEINKLIEVLKQ